MDILDRFKSLFIVDEESGCWNWIGKKLYNGYGRLNNFRAHRFSYEYYIGEIPDGMLVCHYCDNRACVNPEHLFLGTPKENSHDMVDKGRSAKGIHHSQAKLTEEDVKKIKRLLQEGLGNMEVTRQFNISRQAVTDIKFNRTWSHINLDENE